jgi:hypothetical protein
MTIRTPGAAASPAVPCPDCNELNPGERPALPADFIPHVDRDKGPVHFWPKLLLKKSGAGYHSIQRSPRQ